MQADNGVFITFEGGDGAGKSTHLYLVAEALRQRGEEVVCLREPGGTIIGEQLRATVLDPGNYVMADACELLIYEAARAQLVVQVVEPALRVPTMQSQVESTVDQGRVRAESPRMARWAGTPHPWCRGA